MKLSLNEDCWLNNGLCRVINLILLIPCLLLALACITLSGDYEHLYWYIVGAIVVGPIISAGIYSHAVEQTEFFEWDKKERKKKKEFTLVYMCICDMLCTLLLILLLPVMFEFKVFVSPSSFNAVFSIITISLSLVLLIVNIINIPSLYFFLFGDCFSMPYRIVKKPDNWDIEAPGWSLEEQMHNDFGI